MRVWHNAFLVICGALAFVAVPSFAQPARTPCGEALQLQHLNTLEQLGKTGKRIRYNPDADDYANLMYGTGDSTIEGVRTWIANNPRNICIPEARIRLASLEQQKANDDARAHTRQERLDSYRANPTAGASNATFVRPVQIYDYPDSAAGQLVQYELSVAADGTITSCTVPRSSGSSEIDSATCRVMQRQRVMLPARDVKGQPIASVFQGKIRWTPPE